MRWSTWVRWKKSLSAIALMVGLALNAFAAAVICIWISGGQAPFDCPDSQKLEDDRMVSIASVDRCIGYIITGSDTTAILDMETWQRLKDQQMQVGK